MVAIFKKTKKRTSWQTVLMSVMLGILFLGLMGFLLVSNWKINKKRQELNQEIRQLEKQTEILRERKKTLEAGLSQSQAEGFQEEKIRDQGYKKPGEEVIAILRDQAPAGQKQEEEPKGFWLDLWQKIKNIQP
jgi:cell division protein FtsB